MSYSGNSPAGSPLAASQFSPGDQRFARLDGANLAGGFFKNGFTNSAFDIWQRGTATSPDRWLIYAPNNNGGGLTQLALPPGLLPTESRFGCRATFTNNTGLAIIGQKFESVRTFAGKRICIRGWARSTIPVTLQGRHEQNYGTGGSAGTFTNAGSAQIGTVFAPFSIVFDVPALKTTIGPGDQSLAGLYLATTGTFTLDLVDMDVREVIPGFGDQLEPYERVPPEIEFIRCQRHYQNRGFTLYRANTGANFNGGVVSLDFPVQMRVTPTVVTSIIAGIIYPTATSRSVVPSDLGISVDQNTCRIGWATTGAASDYAIISATFNAEL